MSCKKLEFNDGISGRLTYTCNGCRKIHNIKELGWIGPIGKIEDEYNIEKDRQHFCTRAKRVKRNKREEGKLNGTKNYMFIRK